MAVDVSAFLRAQGLSDYDLTCNRRGEPSPTQLARELRGSTAGLVILGVLFVLIGIALPLGFTLTSDKHHADMLPVIWGTSTGIAVVVIGPIAIWQLVVRRNLRKPLVVVEGPIESVAVMGNGAVALRLGGRQFFMKHAAAQRLLDVIEPSQPLRLYTVAGSMGVLAVEPIT